MERSPHPGRFRHGVCDAVGHAVKKSAAQAYFRDVGRKVGEMRVKGFRYREGADAVSSAFARAAGVDGLLSALPLNLVLEERYAVIFALFELE